jgi:hypothetical protein
MKKRRARLHNDEVVLVLFSLYCLCDLKKKNDIIQLNNNNLWGATAHDEPWPLFCSFLIIQRAGRTPSTSDQPVARPLPMQDNTNTKKKTLTKQWD